jgi:hypothetical protein
MNSGSAGRCLGDGSENRGNLSEIHEQCRAGDWLSLELADAKNKVFDLSNVRKHFSNLKISKVLSCFKKNHARIVYLEGEIRLHQERFRNQLRNLPQSEVAIS